MLEFNSKWLATIHQLLRAFSVSVDHVNSHCNPSVSVSKTFLRTEYIPERAVSPLTNERNLRNELSAMLNARTFIGGY